MCCRCFIYVIIEAGECLHEVLFCSEPLFVFCHVSTAAAAVAVIENTSFTTVLPTIRT